MNKSDHNVNLANDTVFIFFLLFLWTGNLSLLQAQVPPSEGDQNRPNIVYILLDDTGFSDLGTYGSEIATPNMDKLARDGLRYNHFESRAICSPTRAALLTGRNSQTVGMMDLARGPFENAPAHSRGYITDAAGTIGQILQLHGYRTTAVGKWHLTPSAEQENEVTGTSENLKNWPKSKGFQNFYGFLSGWTDQYDPHEWGRGRRMIEGSRMASEENPGGNHVSEEIVNKAIHYLEQGFSESPNQPQFLYLAFGATHAPIQAPKEYIDNYRGVYDKGWDEIRLDRFNRQKQLGIIPENAVLTARHAEDPSWDSLTDIEKKVFARFMEVYAGFLEHTDAQVGRLIDYLKESGEYENTTIFLLSDNGAAPEAGEEGNFEHPYFGAMTVSEMNDRLGDLGTANSSALYQRPWARVGSVPFKRYKLWPHGGGVRDPLIISWPSVIKNGGGVRTQYVETIDITPTVLDILNIQAPEAINEVQQLDIHGKSILETFTNPQAPTRTTQFYVMRGNRAIYHDGWKAIAIHKNGTDFEDDKWELYHVKKDFSEAIDLSSQYPEKLEELKALWWSEAEKYGALPLLEFNPERLH